MMENLTPREKVRNGWKWIGVRFGLPLALIGLVMIVVFFKNTGIGATPLLPLLLPFGVILIFTGCFAMLSRYLL